MRKIITILAAFAVLAPVTAHAQERMSDARYLSASRCLAYADLSQLEADSADFTALREAVDYGSRERFLVTRARDTARQIRSNAAHADIDDLRESRNDACANFVAQGLVQLDSSSSS